MGDKYRGYSREVYLELVESAKSYEESDYAVFAGEIGWDSNWMPDFVEDPDADFLNDDERMAINAILISAFEEAHNIRFSKREREHWLKD